MPIFEYRCPNGHTQEVIDLKKEYTHVATLVCSQCGQTAMRVASTTNFGGFVAPKESNISAAIKRVKKAEREGKI